jgi:hypothetical protein
MQTPRHATGSGADAARGLDRAIIAQRVTDRSPCVATADGAAGSTDGTANRHLMPPRHQVQPNIRELA